MQEQVRFSESIEGIIEGFVEGFVEGTSKGEGTRGNVLISHGAGGDMNTKLLRTTAERLAQAGFLVMRWNFGYVTKGGAPSANGRNEQPQMVSAIDFLTSRNSEVPLILIGKSFGGRVGTFIIEKAPAIAAFVFYGLPVRSMNKNAKPRDWSHLSNLTGRALFITGDKDKLCPRSELDEAQRFLKIPFESEFVPGDHSFKPKGEEQAIEICCRWLEKEF